MFNFTLKKHPSSSEDKLIYIYLPIMIHLACSLLHIVESERQKKREKCIRYI